MNTITLILVDGKRIETRYKKEASAVRYALSSIPNIVTATGIKMEKNGSIFGVINETGWTNEKA